MEEIVLIESFKVYQKKILSIFENTFDFFSPQKIKIVSTLEEATRVLPHLILEGKKIFSLRLVIGNLFMPEIQGLFQPLGLIWALRASLQEVPAILYYTRKNHFYHFGENLTEIFKVLKKFNIPCFDLQREEENFKRKLKIIAHY